MEAWSATHRHQFLPANEFYRSQSAPILPMAQTAENMVASQLIAWRTVRPIQDWPTPRVQLTCATMNFLDPVVAFVSGHSSFKSTSERYKNIATTFRDAHIPLVACQEANQTSSRFMMNAGYGVVGLDVDRKQSRGFMPKVLQMPTTDQDEVTPGHSMQGALNYAAFFKRAWSGVQLGFDSKKLMLDGAKPATFYIYPANCQKNWLHTIAAAWHLIQTSTLSCDLRNIQRAGLHLFQSLSGPMRTDGLLITHLLDIKTRKPMIVCATHIESFDRRIALKQLDYMCQEIQQLQQRHPAIDIVINADFNWQVGPGESAQDFQYESISSMLRRRLGAQTMPLTSIAPTLIGQRKAIDGVFFIPAKRDLPRETVRGLSVAPNQHQDQNLKYSDHHAVIATCF